MAGGFFVLPLAIPPISTSYSPYYVSLLLFLATDMKPLACYALGALLSLAACTGHKSATAETEAEDFSGPYNEMYRPQIHFSPAEHWMNDPNGLVYYDGEYHLFYQYYPEKSVWGPMHWGHAVSRDLMHWEHLPIALAPDSLGYIFSGSAVVDWENTSGLGTKENPPLLAFFTYHNPDAEQAKKTEVESQALAYSTDRGRTWTKYAGNPILPNPGDARDFRDPKVFWHKASSRWIVSLACGDEIRFYASPDCKSWTYLSSFGRDRGGHGGVWECPDLFQLPVAGTDETKWVLIVNINPGGPAGGSATQYFVGDFDGKTFTSPQRETLWMDHGADNYAGVTWSDAPDGRRILIGWMNNWLYAGDKPCVIWSGAMTLPRELGLVPGPDGKGYLLTSTPVRELDGLRGETVMLKGLQVDGTLDLTKRIPFVRSALDLRLTFDLAAAKGSLATRYGVRLRNTQGEYIDIGYDRNRQAFYIDRTHAGSKALPVKEFAAVHTAPFVVKGQTVDWRLVIDRASVEFFAAGGRVSMTDVFYPSELFRTVELFTEKGSIHADGEVTQLQSVWNPSK